jgi:hypothetical protein
MADDLSLKAALAALGGASITDAEMALLNLEMLAATQKGLKKLCDKDTRSKIFAYACASMARPATFATNSVLRVLLKICEYSRSASRAVFLNVGIRSCVAVIRRASTPPDTLGLACELLLEMARHTKKFALSMRLEGGVSIIDDRLKPIRVTLFSPHSSWHAGGCPVRFAGDRAGTHGAAARVPAAGEVLRGPQ